MSSIVCTSFSVIFAYFKGLDSESSANNRVCSSFSIGLSSQWNFGQKRRKILYFSGKISKFVLSSKPGCFAIISLKFSNRYSFELNYHSFQYQGNFRKKSGFDSLLFCQSKPHLDLQIRYQLMPNDELF